MVFSEISGAVVRATTKCLERNTTAVEVIKHIVVIRFGLVGDFVVSFVNL